MFSQLLVWSYWQTWSWSSQTPVEKKGLAALFSVPCAFDNFSSQLLSGPQELFSPFFPSFISIPFVGPSFCFDITLLVLVQLFNHGIWHLNHLFFSLSHYAPLIPLLRFLPLLFQFYLFHSVLPTMLCSLIPACLVVQGDYSIYVFVILDLQSCPQPLLKLLRFVLVNAKWILSVSQQQLKLSFTYRANFSFLSHKSKCSSLNAVPMKKFVLYRYMHTLPWTYLCVALHY